MRDEMSVEVWGGRAVPGSGPATHLCMVSYSLSSQTMICDEAREMRFQNTPLALPCSHIRICICCDRVHAVDPSGSLDPSPGKDALRAHGWICARILAVGQ